MFVNFYSRQCSSHAIFYFFFLNKYSSANKSRKLVRLLIVKQTNGQIYKAALLSGAPGVGKTTTAQVVCKELGYDLVEFNASDTRNKNLLKEEVSGLLSNTTMKDFVTGRYVTLDFEVTMSLLLLHVAHYRYHAKDHEETRVADGRSRWYGG